MFKIISSVICVFLLAGCDDGSVLKKSSSQESQATKVASETALYLPGGAGVDFGRKATSERINTNPNGRKIKILSYGFDEAADEIDASLAKILESEGYIRTNPAADNVVLHSVYTKKGYPYVSARYLNQKTKGSDSKTILVLSWEIKS